MFLYLYSYQKKIISIIESFLDNKNLIFIEAPTGSGKSVIINHLSKTLFNQKNKKIIVSTSTIQLSIQLLKNLQQHSTIIENILKKIKIDIVVGKENYLDIKKINLENIIDIVDNPQEFLIQISNRLKSNNNYSYLIDLLLDEIEIEEEKKIILKHILSTNTKKEYIKDFSEVDISVTNHYYLLNKIFFDKNFNLDDYIIIMDEVHTLADVADTILSNTFSLYRYTFLLKKVKNLISYENILGVKTLIKNLDKEHIQAEYLLKKLSNKKMTGQYISTKTEISKFTKKLNSLLKNENLIKQLEKFQKKTKKEEILKFISLLLKEIKELINVKNSDIKHITIYFSPSLGFPRWLIQKENSILYLEKFLWKKINKAIGLSATLTIPEDDEFIFKKLGIFDTKIKKILYKTPPVFSKEQINVYFVNKDFIKLNSNEIEVNKEWIKAIGDYIIDNFENKNSMVLMGNFVEVDALYEYLKKKTNTNILKAERKKSPYVVIEKFKKEGGILIGTRNYGVGIDLEGKLLEKLFITKLPFPVIGTKKWIELKKQDKLRNTNLTFFLMEKEMLLNLKQWIGRLIRTKTDKGDLYILDVRIYKNNRLNKIKILLDEMFN